MYLSQESGLLYVEGKEGLLADIEVYAYDVVTFEKVATYTDRNIASNNGQLGASIYVGNEMFVASESGASDRIWRIGFTV
mgnify:FL=1